jgi:cob(I)alamin adenosyltransferase
MTRLGDRSQVAKTDLRLEACGTVDELNAVLGLAYNNGLDDNMARLVRSIQNDLFDLGADLCVPLATNQEQRLRITTGQVQRLEQEIDALNEDLETLKSFILPGGAGGAAWLHLARTVCRRAERCVWALHERDGVNPEGMKYLNRLSDLLFVLARAENAMGTKDILWTPGKNQESKDEG